MLNYHILDPNPNLLILTLPWDTAQASDCKHVPQFMLKNAEIWKLTDVRNHQLIPIESQVRPNNNLDALSPSISKFIKFYFIIKYLNIKYFNIYFINFKRTKSQLTLVFLKFNSISHKIYSNNYLNNKNLNNTKSYLFIPILIPKNFSWHIAVWHSTSWKKSVKKSQGKQARGQVYAQNSRHSALLRY